MGHPGHVAVTSQRDDEIRPGLREHVPMIGEGRRPAQLRGALRGHRRIRVLDAHEPHLRHARECLEIRGVEQGVPMPDPDRGNPDGQRGSPLPGYSTRMFAALITLAYFAISRLSSAASSSGLLATASSASRG